MRVYLEIAIRSFRRATQYRTAFIAGILTNAFFAAVQSLMYIALFQAGGTVAGFSLAQAITYNWTTQAMISLGAGWISTEMAGTIRSGDVVTDMSRPWSFYGYWMSRTAGERLFNFLVRGSITYLLGVLYFGALVPRPQDALAFLLSALLALVITFAYGFMINLVAFWTLEITGIQLIANSLQAFFSGFLVPIAFFPPWLAALANALPFASVASVPAQILQGKIGGAALGWAIGQQALWAVAMTGAAMLLTRVAMRKVVVQGG